MVKKLIYSLALMLLTVMSAAAQEADSVSVNPEPISGKAPKANAVKRKASTDPFYKADSFIFYYDSYDAQKNKVRLSGRVYYNREPIGEMPAPIIGGLLKSDPIKHIVLSCHPTTTTNVSVPTGPEPLDKEFSRMCETDGDSYMLICPDYCGYGVSTHLQHPYLIHDVTARNCFDALLPAIQAAINLGIPFDGNDYGNEFINKIREGEADKLNLEIVGYSQGGATALACAKLFDSDSCPEDIQKCFNLRQTCCGDGPYSIKRTMERYMEWGDPNREDGGLDLAYPCVLPLIVAAAKEANNDGCMRTVEVEKYFSDEFLATGILDDLKTKNVSTDVLNEKTIRAMPRRRPVDILSRNIIKADGTFRTDTKEYKCFMRAIELADLCSGWEPKHNIVFYHIKADTVVPYVNFDGIMDEGGIGKSDKVTSYEPSECWTGATTVLLSIFKSDFENYPDWSKMKHDAGGQYFYASYMFGSHLAP